MTNGEFLTALRKINNKDSLVFGIHIRPATVFINNMKYTRYSVELGNTNSYDCYNIRKLVKMLLNLSPNKLVCANTLNTVVEVVRIREEDDHIILEYI